MGFLCYYITKEETGEGLVCSLFKLCPSLWKPTHAKCLKRGKDSNPGAHPWPAGTSRKPYSLDSRLWVLSFPLLLGAADQAAGISSASSHTDVDGTSNRLLLIQLIWTKMLRDHLTLSACWMGMKGYQLPAATGSSNRQAEIAAGVRS